MPIDPSIALSVQPMQIQSPLAIFTAVTNLRNQQQEMQERQFNFQQARKRQGELEAISAIVKKHSLNGRMPDPEAVAGDMAAAGLYEDSLKVISGAYDAQKKYLDAQKVMGEVTLQKVGIGVSIAQGIDPTDQASWDRGIRRLDEYLPGAEGQPGMGTMILGPKADKKRLDEVIAQGETATTRVSARNAATVAATALARLEFDRQVHGDTEENNGPIRLKNAFEVLGHFGNYVGDQADYAKGLEELQHGGKTLRSLAEMLPGPEDWQAGVEKAKKMSQSWKDEQAATSQAARDAESRRHNLVTEGISQGQLDLAQQKEGDEKGLTPSMRAGISRLRASLDKMQELDPQLSQRRGFMGKLEGWMLKGEAAMTGEKEDVTVYDAISEALLPALARSSGEVGNLAEKEQARYQKLAPQITDPKNIRQAKYNAILEIASAAERGAKSADMVPMLDYTKNIPKIDVVEVVRDPKTGKLVSVKKGSR